MQLTARLAHVARHATSPRERWSSTSHPALRLGRRPASSSSQSISKRAARPCALAAYHPFPPGCLLPTSLPDGSRCFLAKVGFFHTTAMAHTFFTLHPAIPRHTPQVRRVLVLTLQRPEGCLRCGGGPHAPICRVRPHHALCAASAAAHSPTDTSPLHSPKESGCGTPAATLPTPAISPRLHPSLTRCAADGFDSERKLCQSRGVKGATSRASSRCSPWYASY